MQLPAWLTRYVPYGEIRPLFFLPTEQKRDRAGYQAWIMPLAPIVIVLVALRHALLTFWHDVFEVVSMWTPTPPGRFTSCSCTDRNLRRFRMLKAWSAILVRIGFRFERRENVDRVGWTFTIIPPLYGRLHRKVMEFEVTDIEALNWPA